MGSNAQEEVFALGNSTNSSSTITGGNREYLSANAQRWVDEEVRICESLLLVASLFSEVGSKTFG